MSNENEELKLKINQLNSSKEADRKKREEFSEKIDELNQETDILIEEIDKWQM